MTRPRTLDAESPSPVSCSWSRGEGSRFKRTSTGTTLSGQISNTRSSAGSSRSGRSAPVKALAQETSRAAPAGISQRAGRDLLSFRRATVRSLRKNNDEGYSIVTSESAMCSISAATRRVSSAADDAGRLARTATDLWSMALCTSSMR